MSSQELCSNKRMYITLQIEFFSKFNVDQGWEV